MMKAAGNLLLGTVLGAVMGWALGFLRFPYIEKNLSFLLGFITCLAVLSLGFILLFIWNKNAQVVRFIRKDPEAQNSNHAVRSYAVIWIVVAAFIVLGGLISSSLIYRQNELLEVRAQHQDQRIQEQSELIESIRKSSLVNLMSNMLDKVDDELKNNAAGTLSDHTIATIVAACNYSFEPYRYWEGGRLSEKKLSPEKGQLVMALYTRKIDSVSFNKIKQGATFSGADLRGADLSGMDLSGADLSGADLSEAELNGAGLREADLRNASLWGARLNTAKMGGADFRRADLRWAELNEAELESANLNGADLTNAQLRRADLRKAKFRTAKLDGALLNEANLEGVDLVDASLVKANLTRVNLTKADFYRTNFTEAILTEAELVNANVEKDWFEKLNSWQIAEAKEIQKRYRIELYEVIQDVRRYRLEKN